MTNIFGWRDSRDLSALTLEQYTETQAMADVRRFAADFTAQVNRVERDLICEVSDTAKSKFGLGVGGEMQPYTEGGETEATKVTGTWDLAYPIYGFRSRKLYTEQNLAGIKLEDLEKDIVQEAVSNYETRRKMILRAVLKKTNFTFDDGSSNQEWPKSGLGSLAVKRLCNNDGAEGEVWVNGSKVSIGSLQHYFGSNNATVTITPFETAYDKLRTVGQTADVVVRISPSEETSVRGLTEFKPANNPKIIDPNKVYAQVTSAEAIGRLESDGISAEVVVEPLMPAGYFFMTNRAGGDANKPVKVRVHPLSQFRGWRLVQDETRASYGEASFRNKRWEYIAGAGVRNRVNGVCCQFVASTTYTDPTI